MLGVTVARGATGLRVAFTRPRSLIAAASGIILLATFLPWGRRLGHVTSGWENSARAIALGDAVGSDRLRYLALAWYAIPLLAAMTWVVLGTRPKAAGAVRAMALGSLALTVGSLAGYSASGRPVAVLGPAVASAASIWVAVLAGGIERSDVIRRRD